MLDTYERNVRADKSTVTSCHSFSTGERVVTTEPYRGFDHGLAAMVVSVHPSSDKVTVAPRTVAYRSVFLTVEASSLRHLHS